MIQVYEFSFRQMIYVNAIHVRLPGATSKLTTNAVSGFPPPKNSIRSRIPDSLKRNR